MLLGSPLPAENTSTPQGIVKPLSKSAFPPGFSYQCLLTKELLSLPGFELRTFCVFTGSEM